MLHVLNSVTVNHSRFHLPFMAKYYNCARQAFRLSFSGAINVNYEGSLVVS